jgi:ubiquinone/menaquinone biosynthesis C-methylase UbiE
MSSPRGRQNADPQEFDKVAKLAFAPIYPYLARFIKQKFGITRGICVDVGSGPGSLAIEMARITRLRVFSLDLQEGMTEVAIRNIAEAGLSSRVRAVTADVIRMPFADGSVDLVVSRGSLPFWADRSSAFREICRILRPGGVGYVGGGFGTAEIKSRVFEAFSTNEELKSSREKFLTGMKRPKFRPGQLEAELAASSVAGTVEKECCGVWVQIVKPEGRLRGV